MKIRKLSAHLVLLAGISGVLSWWTDTPILRGQIDPANSVSMKWTTSLCFAMLGLSYALLRWRDSPLATIAAISLAGWASAVMLLLAVASVTGDVDGVVAIGSTAGDSGYQSVGAGVPSWGTMFCFASSGLWATLFAYDKTLARRWILLAYTTGAVGMVAAVSHAFGFPTGYWHHPDLSTGMAQTTATMFILLAIASRSLIRE